MLRQHVLISVQKDQMLGCDLPVYLVSLTRKYIQGGQGFLYILLPAVPAQPRSVPGMLYVQ